ncbi:YcaO-like family protein [Pseudoalteromonas luteoviolacea]|uniref:YcaO-like family protein n=1 Tax=Pseudoalteromonas luteoviolacea TaxID=43657 RepID=UPI001F289D22|nr:YcaO-like family protein [Pseudoalteromonas luteoviolacea]MCF6439362.1 YcaO-like family protein [Pseudoalteromonas luteoviolacea]
MINEIVSWKPSYDVRLLKNGDLLLIDEAEELFLSANDFPLFNKIDGKKTLADICKFSDSIEKNSLFLYLVKHFLNSGKFLALGQSSEIEYNIFDFNEVGNVTIIYSQKMNVAGFTNLLENIFENEKIIVCYDFFASKLRDITVQKLINHESCRIVILKNQHMWCTSRIFSINDFDLLITRLKANKPVLQAVEMIQLSTYYRSPTHFLGYEKYLEKLALHYHKLKSIALNCRHTLTEISLNTGKIQKHDFADLEHIEALSAASNEIILTEQKAYYSNDGGSRTAPVNETLDKIKPFISPITGVITHCEPVEETLNQPIKIFRTAFYKTPQPNALDKVSENSFVQVCLGKGVSPEQSRASALCEAIERRNAQYTGKEHSIYAKQDQLSAPSYTFQSLCAYSTSQYESFSDPHSPEAQRKQAVERYSGEAIHWQAVWSLSCQKTMYVPTVNCFANTPFEDEKFGKWNSNGCAAGNNLEEAILQALFELIERDATAIWWYNKLICPVFELSNIDPVYLTKLNDSLSRTHDYWVLNITSDIGIPVMAAIGKHKDNDGYIFGFGCHLNPIMAAQRALTELCQLIPIRDQNAAPFDFDAVQKGNYLYPHIDVKNRPVKLKDTGDLKQDIESIVGHLKSLGFDTLVLNYSREGLPIKTAKVFVPGLCHIWPQLGNQRLYSTPVKLGLRDEQLNENTINQQGLYI